MKNLSLHLLFGLAMSITCFKANAQELETLLADTTQTPVRLIHRYRTLQKTPIGRPKMLISWYSWKNQVKSDFSSLTGLDNSGTVGKFAALNVNANTSTFNFSPIVINGGDPVMGSFKTIHSIDFSGSVDKSNILDLKKWKSTSLSYSFTYLFSPKYFFLDTPRGTPKHKPLDSEYKNMYDELEKQFIVNLKRARGNVLTELNHPEYADSLELRQAWVDSVAKYEKKLTRNSWTAKQFIWIKVTGTAFSFDNADYLVKGDVGSYASPKSNVTYTPSLLLSANYYFGLRSGLNFYLSAFVQGAIKNTFSEVMTTSVWNKVDPLTDSVMLNMSNKNVYILTSDRVQKKLLPNVGAEGIVFFPSFKYLGLGVHISAALNGLLSDQANKTTGWLYNLQTGLIFSFKDKTGSSTINLEPYYQNKRYVGYALPREHLWGIKFSVPINRLF